MAYNKTIVADTFVQALIEGQAIYNMCNRSFDGLVKQGASSVDIPDLALGVVKKGASAGTTPTDATRKKTKTNTTMVNVPLIPYAIPLSDEILAQYESNGALLKGYLANNALLMQEQFDIDCIAEALTTSNKTAFKGDEMAWADIVALNAQMDIKKVPKAGRLIVIDANLAEEFFNIDVIKAHVSYNPQAMSSGTFIKIMGMNFYISGLVETVTVGEDEKHCMVGWYGNGLAFILSRMGEIKTVWDGDLLADLTDFLGHAGVKLLKSDFAVVKYKN